MNKPIALSFIEGRIYFKTPPQYECPLFCYISNMCVKSEPQKTLEVSKYNNNKKIIYLGNL